MGTKLRRINTRVLKQPERGPKLEYFHATDADVAVWLDVEERRLLDIELTWESREPREGRRWAMWSWDKGWRTGRLEKSSPLVSPNAHPDREVLAEARNLFDKRLTPDERFEFPLEELDRAIKGEARG